MMGKTSERNSKTGAAPAMRSRRALLVFADPAALNCRQRRWPRAFARLFRAAGCATLAPRGCDVHLFTPVEAMSRDCTVHVQPRSEGGFGRRLQNAVERLSALGYQKIVIVGADCPQLNASDIAQAFAQLETKRMVLGPDHRGGCYLIGLDAAAHPDLATIGWHRNTDFAALLAVFGPAQTARLVHKIDLDTLDDVRLLAESAGAERIVAAALLATLVVEYLAPYAQRARRALRRSRLAWQLPPPVVVC